MKTRSAKKLITIPLTAQDLTITAFFATQQLLTNLSNKQDPSLLLSDIAEALHTTPQALSHLPIGTWDDDILRAILDTSVSNLTREEPQTSQTVSDSQTPETLSADSIVESNIETYPTNNIQTIDTEAPEFKDQLSLLGIARHLSNLVSDLSAIARENTKEARTFKQKAKPGSLAHYKASKQKAKGKKPMATKKTVEDLLPECLWFIHKGIKFFLLGRDADVALGHIPYNKLTVGEYTTVKALELQANNTAPQRDKDGKIFIDRELKAVNGKPTGKLLSDEEYEQKMHSAILQDIDIAFNLTLKQVAVLCRRAHEALPQELTERETFITERSRIFEDAPAWIAFAIRGFFLERLLARQLIHAGNLISVDGVHHQA